MAKITMERMQIILRIFRDGVPIDKIVYDMEMSEKEARDIEEAINKQGEISVNAYIKMTAEKLHFVRFICNHVAEMTRNGLLPPNCIREIRLIGDNKAYINVEGCKDASALIALGHVISIDDPARGVWVEATEEGLRKHGLMK